MSDYINRFADKTLQNRLRDAGAVLIQGAKGCGKTETAIRAARSTARLIDEWQEYPQIWNYVRRQVDDRKKRGNLFLPGRQIPKNGQFETPQRGGVCTLRIQSIAQLLVIIPQK